MSNPVVPHVVQEGVGKTVRVVMPCIQYRESPILREGAGAPQSLREYITASTEVRRLYLPSVLVMQQHAGVLSQSRKAATQSAFSCYRFRSIFRVFFCARETVHGSTVAIARSLFAGGAIIHSPSFFRDSAGVPGRGRRDTGARALRTWARENGLLSAAAANCESNGVVVAERYHGFTCSNFFRSARDAVALPRAATAFSEGHP